MIEPNASDSVTFTGFIIVLAGSFVSGFVAWTVKQIISNKNDVSSIRLKLSDLQLHVAEHYPKKDDLKELKAEVQGIARIIYEIAGKLGVPIRKEVT